LRRSAARRARRRAPAGRLAAIRAAHPPALGALRGAGPGAISIVDRRRRPRGHVAHRVSRFGSRAHRARRSDRLHAPARRRIEHTESTKRQYGLVERAQALGWSPTKISVIDEDQGKSGASAEGRDGFQRLVDAVVKGDAGAILAVEVSRLSRSSEDWR